MRSRIRGMSRGDNFFGVVVLAPGVILLSCERDGFWSNWLMNRFILQVVASEEGSKVEGRKRKVSKSTEEETSMTKRQFTSSIEHCNQYSYGCNALFSYIFLITFVIPRNFAP